MSRYRQSMSEALREVAKSEVLDEAVKWEVKISGLPLFYVDGKSRGAVRQALRKMLKRPDDIASIERTTSTELKKIRRGQAQGQEPGEANEEVEDAYDYKAKKGAIAAPGSGSIAKAKKAKAGDVNKSIEQQMKDALKEKMSVDDVVNAIQFGKPFKVVDEDIPAKLPPGQEVPKYKDISNAEVDKEDKKANKVKDKIEKDTLVPTQTQEGKMEDFHALIKQGKSADEIAKTLDLDTKTVKELMPEATAAELELANAKKADKKQQGGSLRHKIWPASASMRMPKLEDAASKVLEQEGGVTDDSGYTRYPSSGNWAGIKGKTYKKNLAKAQTKQTSQDKARDASMKMGAVPGGRAEETAQAKDAKDQDKDPVGKIRKESVNRIAERLKKKVVSEVAPPGWGHTKAEKEKTKPDKPKSKIGGSAHEFQKDLDSGKFKGLPGDKTYKDKKASMFKLMWSMKDKGDKPHYKPGVKDKLKSQYKEENILDSAKRYLNEKADWNTAFKSAAQSRPPMKYKDAVSFIDTAGLNSTEKRSALKAAKKWLR